MSHNMGAQIVQNPWKLNKQALFTSSLKSLGTRLYLAKCCVH